MAGLYSEQALRPVLKESRRLTGRGQLDANEPNHRWWELEKGLRHTGITPVTKHILEQSSLRRRMNRFFSGLYNDSAAQSMAARTHNLYYQEAALSANSFLATSLTLNVLQNCIDTACALISKNKPKPQFITDGSKDYETKLKGKQLTKYIEGLYDHLDLYTVAQRVFRDACIYGTGALKLYLSDGEIKADHLFIEEVLIDEIDGMHGKPTQMHQRKFIDTDTLIGMFPDYREEILAAGHAPTGSLSHSTVRVLPVIESWHLPSGRKAKDGLHTITIDNCDLFAETYDKDFFPVLFFFWDFNTLGFHGRGICHEIWKCQRDLDITLQTIQRAQRLISGPIIAVEAGSNIAEDHLTSNRLAKIVKYSVVEPKILTPPAVNPELYQWAQYLEDRMYKITGVSQAMATGQKPEDVKSAVAIREVSDIATGRFELIGQRWENWHLGITRVLVDLSNDLQKEKPDLSMLVIDRGKGRRLNFADVKADLKDYKLQLFPVSGLPSTPAGRLDQLMDYAQAGYLSREQVMDIADFPDLEDAVSLETASLNLTQELLSEIKVHGKYIPPGAYLNLPIAFRMACLEIDRSQLQGVEEDNIDLLRRWADECQTLMQSAQQQQQAMAPQPQQNAGTSAQVGQAAANNMLPTQAGPPQPGPEPPPTQG